MARARGWAAGLALVVTSGSAAATPAQPGPDAAAGWTWRYSVSDDTRHADVDLDDATWPTTGLPAVGGDRDVILEAFKPGTVPTAQSRVLGGGQDGEAGNGDGESPATGTGGLY